jgi:hypothetical protein
MSVALDQQTRTALERFVQRSRRLLEEDLSREAEGRFGIHVADGEIEDEDGLHLDPSGLAARRDVVEILEFLRTEEGSGADAVARLVREAAFTHLNRLVAIRVAEAIDLLPESLANGSSSAGFRELLEVAPLLAHDAAGGYWRYLQLCGDELAADLPQLFDPRNPLLELAPSPAAFDQLVEMIGADELDGVWDAPDALGWAYQFFNSGDERRAMRDASASPRTSRELAVRNQFFTPRYVVDFLVHNSLGRRLLEADPASGLVDHLPMLLDPPTEKGAPLALADVRVLDPACGSGHFLLGAYDVLERAWELQGVSPSEAAPAIVASLWGIDIDARCSQVAAAAVILRARRHCKTDDLPVPNVITARALPEPTEGWDALLDSLPHDRRQLVVSIREALERAPVLGPLLKVEELLATEIRSRVIGAEEDPSTLFGAAGIANDAFGRAEADVLAVLQRVADNATSGPADRLFAAQAQDSIRFVEAMRGRYDAVLMNPPFGDPAIGTKPLLRAMYPWLPGNGDLLAAFVGRGIELANSEGSVGAITSRVGLFLTTYEAWRREVLLANEVVAIADLGFGVMEQALVEAAAYVVKRSGPSDASAITCVRLLKERDMAKGLAEATESVRSDRADQRVFVLPRSDILELPGAPFAYWAHVSFRRLFGQLPSIEGGIAKAKMGLSTGDDFRFVRLWWEASPSDGDWIPYAKGGEYSPFFFEPHLVVDWTNEGDSIRNSGASWVALRNQTFYFKPGVSWPRRTASGFGPRILPAGCIFGDKGPTAFCLEEDVEPLLGWLLSRPVSAMLSFLLAAGDETSSGTASKSYEVGLVQRLPWLPIARDAPMSLAMRELIQLGCSNVIRRLETDETSRYFTGPSLLRFPSDALRTSVDQALCSSEDLHVDLIDASLGVDRLIADALILDDDAQKFLDGEVGAHPGGLAEVVDVAALSGRVSALYEASMSEVINTFLEAGGGSRVIATQNFIADRRLEVISHGLGFHPRSVVTARRHAGVLPVGLAEAQAGQFISFLFGVSIGRWMLPSDDQMAAWSDRLVVDLLGGMPSCSSLALAAKDGIKMLLDEPGHPADVVAAIEGVASSGQVRSLLLQQAVSALGERSLRQYLRKSFFRSHLSAYSKSRRNAPIYWPLTVPSGNWGIWVYAPVLDREALYAIAAHARRREGQAIAEVVRLEQERSSGGSGRTLKSLDKALDGERKLTEELRRFGDVAERIAGLGWAPDMNDGTGLCAAPLADIFPAWKDAARYRKELRAGKHEWATVARWAGEL